MEKINDITNLNPIEVANVIQPESIEEIAEALSTTNAPVSIGGGRYSMGGQVSYEDSLHIDMRKMNNIIDYDPKSSTITVQGGTTWRQIQELIDKDGLAIKIMQTYANFTVGGSVSVNAHGRYIGQGPLIYSIKALKLALADGTIMEVSPEKHKDLFYGAIGGYGALGVIIEVTLQLTKNIKIERQERKLDVDEYLKYFIDHVRKNKGAVFHNADLYPPHYSKARAITWFETDKPLTSNIRIATPKSSYALERYLSWAITETPFGKWRREYVFDPLIYIRNKVTWRNTEASCYDVKELEPRSRQKTTYVLQEYFVPIQRINDFIPLIAEILNRYHVNALNISIRHANKDPGSLLAWAKDEVFAFVLYYKQGTSDIDKEIVGIWTRELIDAALSVGGSYYLPYQPHATQIQFEKCYPNAPYFFNIKKKYDPQYKFRNKLWQKYYEKNGKESVMSDQTSEFRSIYADTQWRDRFFLFLQNVYNIYPEDKLHHLIKQKCEQYTSDQEIYEAIQKDLPGIKPFLVDLRYAVPALIKQKKEMANQTVELLGKEKEYKGYLEIGSPGRYISELKKHLKIKGPIYLINDYEPTFSPVDIAERGSITKIGKYVALDDYKEISPDDIPEESLDLVTCYIGLHHCPLNKLDEFIESIVKTLRPGGKFVIRDHNVDTPEMRTFVSLVHAVFNAGLNISWLENTKELRYFTSNSDLVDLLEKNGLSDTGKRLLQKNDPSLNTLMEFTKI